MCKIPGFLTFFLEKWKIGIPTYRFAIGFAVR